MDNYGEPLYDKFNNLIGYKINNNKCVSIVTYYNENNLLCNKVSIREFDENTLSFINYPLKNWVDIKTESGFVREYNKKKYNYDKNNKLLSVEAEYNYPSFPIYKKDANYDIKIGTLDLETFGENLGLGQHQVYAGGWATKESQKFFYLNTNETSEQLVNKIFLSIFMVNDLDGYTFYVHNLGRFDSVFIIKSLILNDNIIITPIWKDNSIISLKIKYNKISITLLDSLQLISGSLDSNLKSFNCNVQKGHFPYEFVKDSKLYYIGDKPSIKFDINFTELEYQSIPIKNWNLKKETNKYLKADLEGLLEALIKFNLNIFNKYQLNITKFKTLPSLAISSYFSSYLPDNLKKKI